MPAQSPKYTRPPTTAGVAETSPAAVNFHFVVSRATLCGVIGFEAELARVPHTFPPNIGQPPASPAEQSSGVGGVVVDTGVGAGVEVEELWHAGPASPP